MTRYKMINGVRSECTAEEEAWLNSLKTAWDNKALDRALEALRLKRNKLLAETDYFSLSDNTMSEEMTTYRQKLRDITNGLTTAEEVEAVEFPTKP